MSGPGLALGWYATCCAYLASPPEIRREVSPQTLATYRRIRRLPRAWGEELDRLGAPLFVMRWVAWAAEPAERERRYTAALTSWEQGGRWPRWDGLTCRDGEVGRGSARSREKAEEPPRATRAADPGKRRAGENRRRGRAARGSAKGLDIS